AGSAHSRCTMKSSKRRQVIGFIVLALVAAYLAASFGRDNDAPTNPLTNRIVPEQASAEKKENDGETPLAVRFGVEDGKLTYDELLAAIEKGEIKRAAI